MYRLVIKNSESEPTVLAASSLFELDFLADSARNGDYDPAQGFAMAVREEILCDKHGWQRIDVGACEACYDEYCEGLL